MTDTTATEKSLTNGIRVALGIGGVVAVVLGVLILIAPLKSAAVITAIIAIYAIVQGLIYLGIGIFSKTLKVWPRIGHIVLGLLFIVAGVFALGDLGNVTAFLAIFVAIFIGASWVVQGIVAFTLLGAAESRGWTIFFGIVSIIAGIVVILAPFWAIAFLWLVLAISLVVLGIVQIVRAFAFGRTV